MRKWDTLVKKVSYPKGGDYIVKKKNSTTAHPKYQGPVCFNFQTWMHQVVEKATYCEPCHMQQTLFLQCIYYESNCKCSISMNIVVSNENFFYTNSEWIYCLMILFSFFLCWTQAASCLHICYNFRLTTKSRKLLVVSSGLHKPVS
jgi:hypothetical protein